MPRKLRGPVLPQIEASLVEKNLVTCFPPDAAYM